MLALNHGFEMDMNSWSLVLGIAGLLLGLVSAFSQLKAMTMAALRIGGDKARKWGERIDARADLFSKSPSALIAYLAQSTLFVIAVLIVGSFVFGLAKDPSLQFPAWVRSAVSFATGGLIGNKFADVSIMMRLVRRKTTAERPASSVEG